MSVIQQLWHQLYLLGLPIHWNQLLPRRQNALKRARDAASESRKTTRSVSAMEALLLMVTAVQRYHSFVVGGHAGIEQTSVIVEGDDNNFCACSSSGWRLMASVGCMCSCVLASITGSHWQ